MHRQKTEQKEASHVAIPIGDALESIIDSSRDNVASPYVVHRLPKKRSNRISQEVNHPTQVAPDYLSRAFLALRDQVGVAASLPPEQRPTFHEIRALAAFLFKQQGCDPQARMAHADAKSTKIYTENHVEWVHVPHAEIRPIFMSRQRKGSLLRAERPGEATMKQQTAILIATLVIAAAATVLLLSSAVAADPNRSNKQ